MMNPIQTHAKNKAKAFLDSNVILSFLRDDCKTRHLFDRTVLSRFDFIISTIVLQEVYPVVELTKTKMKNPRKELFKALSSIDVIDLKQQNLEELSKSVRLLRNQIVHSNDILNIQLALTQCKFFVTLDNALLKLERVQNLRFITPSELVTGVGLK